MISTIRVRVLLGLAALLIAGIAYSQVPTQQSEANVTSLTYQAFSYNAGFATYTVRVVWNDTFATVITFNPIGPATATATAASAGTCTAFPAPAPIICTVPPAAGVNTFLDLIVRVPVAQQCTASVATIGPVTAVQTSAFTPPNQMSLPATTSVGGVQNTVPANPALCSTPIPNTPTPVPTVVIPSIEPIPQVVQNPARGGIFNGSRNDTPTPVRPREVGTAGSTGVGLPPAGVLPALRPPSTGDAGLLKARVLRVSTW